MEDGRGENVEVPLIGTELLHSSRMWEGLGIRFGVAKHLFQFGVIERTVNGGVNVFRWWGVGGDGPVGESESGGAVGREGLPVGQGGGLSSCREGLRGGRGANSGGCRAGCGGRRAGCEGP